MGFLVFFNLSIPTLTAIAQGRHSPLRDGQEFRSPASTLPSSYTLSSECVPQWLSRYLSLSLIRLTKAVPGAVLDARGKNRLMREKDMQTVVIATRRANIYRRRAMEIQRWGGLIA